MTDSRTPDRDVNRAIRSWLGEDRHEDVSRIAGAVLDRLDTTPQRRATAWPARRPPTMNKIVAYGLAAAAVVVAVFVGAQFFGQSANTGGGPDASPTPELTASPTAEPTPSPSADAGLPVGPFAIDDPLAPEGAPSITVTIPSPGWTYNPDFSVLAKGVEVANLPEAAILLWTYEPGATFYVPEDPCRVTSTRPDSPATTVDDFAAALAAQASRDATEPLDVTVGGYAGKSLILHVPDDAVSGECEAGEFVSWGVDEEPVDRYHQGPGQIDELWILDVEGSIVVFDAMSRPDSRADFVEELRTIAESATFELP